MEKKLDELLAKIERYKTELKENGDRTAITKEHIQFMEYLFAGAMSVYTRAEKEINFILNDVNEYINKI